ncbi:MAG: FadR family transcriptional regulator [Firmicutes bacterium]|nr:FadR family transcriptional regulator [Bacillota bacterium]
MKIKPIEKMSTLDSVIKTLKDEIIMGKIKIGDKLPTERVLSRKLNVGRSTVREAIKVLQALGLVKVKQGKGTYVLRKNENESLNIANWFSEHELQITDLMDIRLAMEPLAIKLALKRSSDEEFEKLMKDLNSTNKKLKTAIKENNVIKMEVIDNTFHSYVSEATRNNLLISINEKISEAILEYRIKIFSIKENAENAYKAHQEIINAMTTKDVARAVSAMTSHVNSALSDAIKLIKKN